MKPRTVAILYVDYQDKGCTKIDAIVTSTKSDDEIILDHVIAMGIFPDIPRNEVEAEMNAHSDDFIHKVQDITTLLP